MLAYSLIIETIKNNNESQTIEFPSTI